MVDLLFYLFEFSCFDYVEFETDLLVWSNPNQSYRRSAIQWYFLTNSLFWLIFIINLVKTWQLLKFQNLNIFAKCWMKEVLWKLFWQNSEKFFLQISGKNQKYCSFLRIPCICCTLLTSFWRDILTKVSYFISIGKMHFLFEYFGVKVFGDS